jgi:uncharacterized protein YrrD
MQQPPAQQPENMPPYSNQAPGQEPGEGAAYSTQPPQQPEQAPSQMPGQQPGSPYAQPGQVSGAGNWVTFSQLRGHPLIDTSKGQKVGDVQDILLDPQLQGIQAFSYKAGLFQRPNIIPAAQARIGVDAVTFQPGPQPEQDVSQMGQLPKASDTVGRRVFTDTGRLLGVVDDLRFDQNSHRLLGVELAPEGAAGRGQRIGAAREQLLPTQSIINFGPDALIVNEQALSGF